MTAKPIKNRNATERVTAAEIIRTLAELHGMTHEDGSVIQAEFARRSGISQSTLSRILSGSGDWQFTRDSQLKLVEAFGITQAEAAGLRPISKAALKTKIEPTPRELEFIRAYRSLPSNDRKDIETLISLKSALRSSQEK